MKIQCNHFETDPKSCRFYVLETTDGTPEGRLTGKRYKVHVDGEVSFQTVKDAFQAQGVDVPLEALKHAYG